GFFPLRSPSNNRPGTVPRPAVLVSNPAPRERTPDAHSPPLHPDVNLVDVQPFSRSVRIRVPGRANEPRQHFVTSSHINRYPCSHNGTNQPVLPAVSDNRRQC